MAIFNLFSSLRFFFFSLTSTCTVCTYHFRFGILKVQFGESNRDFTLPIVFVKRLSETKYIIIRNYNDNECANTSTKYKYGDDNKQEPKSLRYKMLQCYVKLRLLLAVPVCTVLVLILRIIS
jgi:hypothetical protein